MSESWQNYEQKKMEFDWFSEKKHSYLGFHIECLEDRSELRHELIYGTTMSDSLKIEIRKDTQIRIKKIRPKSKHPKISVFKAREIRGTYYVLISVVVKNKHVDYYFFEIDSDGSILSNCESSEII